MSDLSKLAAYFQPDELEWRAITISKRTNKGLTAAYVTNRAVMQRFDDVVGPANWRNEYQPGPLGGVVCGLSVNVTLDPANPHWVTKWDGADNTDVEAIKGGLSNAMRRAAVHWGVGRYLYDFPQQWVPVDDFKQFKTTPRVPNCFLPGNEPQATRVERTDAEREEIAEETRALVYGKAEALGFDHDRAEKAAQYACKCSVGDLDATGIARVISALEAKAEQEAGSDQDGEDQ